MKRQTDEREGRGSADRRGISGLERFLLPLFFIAMWMPAPSFARQVAVSSSFSHARSQAIQATSPFTQNPAAPAYDVIALRVEFQPDTSRFTTGDGLFEGNLFGALTASVDPLPHDAAYFDAHLQFLENYVAKVSDGQTIVRTHLLPEIIRVSGQMGDYSPTGPDADSDAELTKLARLAQEAWTLAGAQSSFSMAGFDPATTAFVVFHAGVGRDIELVGTTLDKTPQDIPTIFFDVAAFDRLLGGPLAFKGFTVDHTIVLPRTESRTGFDFIQDAPFLVEFSINGLMAASFFNFLGVPDLFDTETGQSAIGPFGLMDPLGLFAYNGLFPPEPTAWTKQYLAWTDPVIVEGPGDTVLTLHATSGSAFPEAARVPISSAEYFLVENRHRDLEGNGLVLTIYRDGRLVEQRIENGAEDFNSLDISGFEGGVVVDVDDFDWALPGGVDADGNDLLGGMLVWHVDERILAQGLPDNRVTADPPRRAIDLEEADSAQDIGFPSDNPFAPQNHLGSPFDFFYEGNPVVVISRTGQEVRLYQNRFGPDTYPDSRTNAGGSSFIVLDAFSPPGPAMSFTFKREEAGGVRPVEGLPQMEGAIVPGGSYVTALAGPSQGVVFQSGPGELAISIDGAAEPVVLQGYRVVSPVISPDGRIVALDVDAQGEAGLLIWQEGQVSRVPLGVQAGAGTVAAHHLLFEASSDRLAALITGDDGDRIYRIDLGGDNQLQSLEQIAISPRLFSMAAADDGRIAILSSDGVAWDTGEQGWSYSLDPTATVGSLALGHDAAGWTGAFSLISEEKLILLLPDGTVREIDLTPFGPAGASRWLNRYPILVDVDGDDRLETLLTYGPQILAFSAGGGLVDGFPVTLPASVTSQPLIARLGEQANWTVFLADVDGNLYAYDLDAGRSPAGFPLAGGFRFTATPILKDGRLFTVDEEGALKAWEIQALGTVWWGQQHGNRFNTSFVRRIPAGGGEMPEGLLAPDEVYNWPNPILNGQTFFRLTPVQDVAIKITIIDAAGELIEVIDVGSVRGGASMDIPWQTEASSGLYYARVEAISPGGASETALVKMAIIR